MWSWFYQEVQKNLLGSIKWSLSVPDCTAWKQTAWEPYSTERGIRQLKPPVFGWVKSGRLSFPPAATVLSTEQLVRCVWQMSYDLAGIPFKPVLVPFSKLNPRPSNRCHKLAILVGFIFTGVLREFAAGCACRQRMAPAFMRRRQSVSVLHWRWQQDKQRVFSCDVTRPYRTSRQRSRPTSNEITRIPVEGSWALEQHCVRAQVPVLRQSG